LLLARLLWPVKQIERKHIVVVLFAPGTSAIITIHRSIPTRTKRLPFAAAVTGVVISVVGVETNCVALVCVAATANGARVKPATVSTAGNHGAVFVVDLALGVRAVATVAYTRGARGPPTVWVRHFERLPLPS